MKQIFFILFFNILICNALHPSQRSLFNRRRKFINFRKDILENTRSRKNLGSTSGQKRCKKCNSITKRCITGYVCQNEEPWQHNPKTDTKGKRLSVCRALGSSGQTKCSGEGTVSKCQRCSCSQQCGPGLQCCFGDGDTCSSGPYGVNGCKWRCTPWNGDFDKNPMGICVTSPGGKWSDCNDKECTDCRTESTGWEQRPGCAPIPEPECGAVCIAIICCACACVCVCFVLCLCAGLSGAGEKYNNTEEIKENEKENVNRVKRKFSYI